MIPSYALHLLKTELAKQEALYATYKRTSIDVKSFKDTYEYRIKSLKQAIKLVNDNDRAIKFMEN